MSKRQLVAGSALAIAIVFTVIWLIIRSPVQSDKEIAVVFPGARPLVSFPTSKPEAPWLVKPIFEQLAFERPIQLVESPAHPDLLFVLEQDGRIYTIDTSNPLPKKALVLDFTDNVIFDRRSEGVRSMQLHPEFGSDSANSRYFFVGYTATKDGQSFNRLSRFTIDLESLQADLASELVLIDQFDPRPDHNGGAIVFDSDGFLYFTVGDGGSYPPGVPSSVATMQEIDRGLFSGVLRIDVDKKAGSVSQPIKRRPADAVTDHYYIPSDNPFVGVPGAMEEFWSIGFREPYSMSYDPIEGNLWVADVGGAMYEEINLTFKGANHQWNYKEGLVDGNSGKKRPDPFLGTEAPPVYAYSHAAVQSSCAAVIGGGVYRGTVFEELAGQYLFGDFCSGEIYSLDWQTSPAAAEKLFSLNFFPTGGMASIFLSRAGEVYFVSLGARGKSDGAILKMKRNTAYSESAAKQAALPEKLSDTGLFTDFQNMTPAKELVAYEVNSPLWSDGAIKTRWVMMPHQKEESPGRIKVSEDASLAFPTGSVFVKHFEIDVFNPYGDTLRRKLETRVIVKTDQHVYGVTYVWNKNETDATLLKTPLERPLTVVHDGEIVSFNWIFPTSEQCLKCHNTSTSGVLGFNMRQINRAHATNGLNQISVFNQLGMFEPTFAESDINELPRLVSPDDEGAPLDDRARSYIDANCSSCHHPESNVRSYFDARYSTPLDQQGIVDGPLEQDFGVPDARVIAPGKPAQSMMLQRMIDNDPALRMPPLGRELVDPLANALFLEWILALDSNTAVTVDQ